MEEVMNEMRAMGQAIHELQRQNEELRARAREPAPAPEIPAPQPAGARLPVPEDYSGEEAADGWLFAMGEYILAARIADGVSFAAMKLRGEARTWWQTRIAANEEARNMGWEAWSAALRDQFGAVDAQEDAMASLDRLTQTGTVAEYAAKFRRLTLHLPAGEPWLLHAYRNKKKENSRFKHGENSP